MLIVSYCCCGCPLDDGVKKIGWFMVVMGLLYVTMDMFKLAILVKDPELAHTDKHPDLFANMTNEEVIDIKKATLIGFLTLEGAEVLFGLVLICGVNCKSMCMVIMSFTYFVLVTLVTTADFVLLWYDPLLLYAVSMTKATPGGPYHYIDIAVSALHLILQLYFCRVLISYTCVLHNPQYHP